jgi:hypothetical protein
VAPSTVRYLKTEDGMGVGIERLVLCMEHVFTGGRPPAFEDYGDTSFTAYWNQYGLLGFTDENNLSLVVFVTCGQHKFIFPGDMESEGWRQLLRNPAFVAELHGVNVFVASHHGRENGYCEEVLNLCPAIEVFIISDKHTGAYWLLLDLRAAITSWNPLRHTEFATIRLRLLKIAGRFIEHRISRIWLASGDRQLVRSMR